VACEDELATDDAPNIRRQDDGRAPWVKGLTSASRAQGLTTWLAEEPELHAETHPDQKPDAR
jgi:hypothetical protein